MEAPEGTRKVDTVAHFSEKAVARELDNLGANVLILPKSATVSDYYSADLVCFGTAFRPEAKHQLPRRTQLPVTCTGVHNSVAPLSCDYPDVLAARGELPCLLVVHHIESGLQTGRCRLFTGKRRSFDEVSNAV